MRLRSCLHLVLKCVSGNQATSGQRRHVYIYTCVTRIVRLQGVHLTTFAKKVHTHSYVKKVKNVTPAIYLHYFLALMPRITVLVSIFFFWVTKTTTTSRINDVVSGHVRFMDTSGRISVYTAKGLWSKVSRTTSANGLSECVL